MFGSDRPVQNYSDDDAQSTVSVVMYRIDPINGMITGDRILEKADT